MKINIYYLALSLTTLLKLNACSNKNDNASTEKALSYFGNLDNDVQTVGIKVIPITTPKKGKFNIWTKRTGNPSMKVLILHGGTHEAYECFESF
jgi:proline iminopeptidase